MKTPRTESPADDTAQASSKTQRKNDAHALQQLGAELVALSRAQLLQLDLHEPLLDAVLAAQRIDAHEGKRRQLQFIGKLMRNVDPAPIQARLDEWKAVPAAQVARMHRLENWRERLLAEPGALNELATEFPHADLQQLRTLIRNVQREREQGKPPKNYRAMFQFLRDIIPA